MAAVLRVDLPDTAYEIAIAPQNLDTIGTQMAGLNLGKKVLLISNPEIEQFYGDRVRDALSTAGFNVATHLIPAGEEYKTLASIEQVYDAALAHRLERSSTMVALGGGVIGDMTGFAAATWLRGINFVQAPTSLLAMVDASVGGKTGVNHPQGKNLIGAFYQPKLVLIDPTVLATLPPREFRAGMAEVIKYGVIWDADLFAQLEAAEGLSSYETIDSQLLETILVRSCQAKAAVVSQDEKEAGLRAILNYGHTLGHAVESLTQYRLVNHGEAVAIGMVAAGQLAAQLDLWTTAEAERQDKLITQTGLPTQIPGQLAVAEIVDTLQTDKKVKAGKVQFILPTTLGQVKITDQVPAEVLAGVIQNCQVC
ncbi:MAG: 3-dehydroquinate synthase [Spirulina sp. SIO3F2]|nr:3-dehydroquinate synthase [Spirulina sp. SIO3F2]